MAETKGTKEATEQQSSLNTQTQQTQREGQAGGNQPMSRERGRQQGLWRRDPFEQTAWRANTFDLMNRYVSEMERLFENLGFGRGLLEPFGRQRGYGEMTESKWSPEIEVFEGDGNIIVRADLPGMTKDNVRVDITDTALTIEGERRDEREERREGFYRSERSYGSFHRTIPLPEGVDGDNAKAEFRDGVLEITIPAPERAQRRRQIEIGEGTKGEQLRAGAKTANK